MVIGKYKYAYISQCSTQAAGNPHRNQMQEAGGEASAPGEREGKMEQWEIGNCTSLYFDMRCFSNTFPRARIRKEEKNILWKNYNIKASREVVPCDVAHWFSYFVLCHQEYNCNTYLRVLCSLFCFHPYCLFFNATILSFNISLFEYSLESIDVFQANVIFSC